MLKFLKVFLFFVHCPLFFHVVLDRVRIDPNVLLLERAAIENFDNMVESMKRAKSNPLPPARHTIGFPRMISLGNYTPGNTTFLGLMNATEITPIHPLLPFPDKASYVPLNTSFDPSSSGPSTVAAIDTPSAIDAHITASETPTATMSAMA